MQQTYTEGLIFFTDISGFARMSRELNLDELVEYLQTFAKISLETVEAAGGTVIKYIGDSVLGYFPTDRVDDGVEAFRQMQQRCGKELAIGKMECVLKISAHYGEFAIFPLPGNAGMEVAGVNVNIAARAGAGGSHRDRIILTPEAFRKLSPHARKQFHKYTEPVVYLADR